MIGPFLFIALGHPEKPFYQRRLSLGLPGVYVLSLGTNRFETPLAGFILPLNSCRDKGLAKALHFASAVLADPLELPLLESRLLTELNEAGLPITALPSSAYNGFIALSDLDDALPVLADTMSYATRIFDDPDGEVRITETEPFPYRDYWSLLRWLHQDNRRHDWSHPSLFLVNKGVVPFRQWWKEYWRHGKVVSPKADLPQFFQLRDDLLEQLFSVFFIQEDHGWIQLTLMLGEQRIDIDISNVFPPFTAMIEWLKKIDDAKTSSAFSIDEEGCEKRLEVLVTDDPQRLFFLVKDDLDEPIYLQGIIGRDRLLSRFKAAIFDFFQNDFSPARWGGSLIYTGEEMRRDILADPWFRHTQRRR